MRQHLTTIAVAAAVALVLGLVTGVAIGRSDAASGASFDSQKAGSEKQELVDRLARAERELAEAKALIEKLQGELQAAPPGLDVGGAVGKAQQELEALKKRLDDAQAEAAKQLEAAKAQLEQTKTQMLAKVDEARAGVQAAVDQQTQALRQEVDKLKAELAQAKQEAQSAKDESARWRAQGSTCSIRNRCRPTTLCCRRKR